MKRCSKCGAYKPATEFWRDKRRQDGRYQHCKPCSKAATDAWRSANPDKVAAYQQRSRAKRSPLHNAYLRLARYGLTATAYELLLNTQRGRCAICSREMSAPREPHVDHDHVDDRVRALLCSLCNKGLGHFHDDPDLLRAAANYLEVHRTCPHPD